MGERSWEEKERIIIFLNWIYREYLIRAQKSNYLLIIHEFSLNDDDAINDEYDFEVKKKIQKYVLISHLYASCIIAPWNIWMKFSISS